MHGNVEIGDMGVALFVEEDVIRLEISDCSFDEAKSGRAKGRNGEEWMSGDAVEQPRC